MTTTSKDEIPEEFPCPICGEMCEIGISKKKKPYFHCTPCGVQVFIRGTSGIERLIELQNNSELMDKLESLVILDSSKLLQLNTRINLIRAEIQKYREKESIFDSISDENQNKVRLEAELTALEDEYSNALLQTNEKV